MCLPQPLTKPHSDFLLLSEDTNLICCFCLLFFEFFMAAGFVQKKTKWPLQTLCGLSALVVPGQLKMANPDYWGQWQDYPFSRLAITVYCAESLPQNSPVQEWTRKFRALLCALWWLIIVNSQSQTRKRLLLASRGHLIWRLAYQASCINLPHQAHPLDLALKASRARRAATIQLLILTLVYRS